MGNPHTATPVPRQRTPATQAGQWGSQPPHHQTDREATVVAAPDAHPNSYPPPVNDWAIPPGPLTSRRPYQGSARLGVAALDAGDVAGAATELGGGLPDGA